MFALILCFDLRLAPQAFKLQPCVACTYIYLTDGFRSHFQPSKLFPLFPPFAPPEYVHDLRPPLLNSA